MFSKISCLGIKTKWMIYTFVFIILFSSILVSFFITTGKRDLEQESKKWGISLTKNLADNVRATVLNKDYATLKSHLYGVMNYKEIIYSVIIDESGSILALEDPHSMVTSRILDGSLNLAAGKVEELHTSGGKVYYNLVEPITIEKEADLKSSNIPFDPMERVVSELNSLQSSQSKERLGIVILGLSLEDMNIKLERMRDKAIYIAFVSTLFVFVFVFWSVERMTSPIKNLDKATRKIAQGDLSQFVENNRVDELGRLADSFNEMIVKLKESQEKEKLYTHNLERQVSERTYELQVSEQKYRTLFEHAGTAVVLINNDGKFSMINRGFEVLSQFSQKELEGKMIFSDFLSSNDCNKIQGICCSSDEYDPANFPLNHECTFVDRTGTPKKINLTISLIPDTTNLLVSIVDVTELRELQKRLTRSQQLAVLGELSASIAHEIRNPLVAINTSVGILKNGLNLNDEDQELMNIISEESMRLNKIVVDFLKFARPNEPQFMNTDINVLIQETLIILQGRFNNDRIQKHIDLSEDLPMAFVDADQIKQVLMNMIINAIEAMPKGGELDISTKHVERRTGYSQLEISIKDTGNGLKDSDLKKIFQPFYSTKNNGVGMGLAICERIIQNHNGEIRIESKYGEGTKFTIILNSKINLKV